MELLKVTAEPDNEKHNIDYDVKLSPETKEQFKDEKYIRYLKNRVIEDFISAITLNSNGSEVPEDVPLLISFELRPSTNDETMLSVMCKEGPEMADLKENIHPIRSKKIEHDFIDAVLEAFHIYYNELYEEKLTSEEIMQNDKSLE